MWSLKVGQSVDPSFRKLILNTTLPKIMYTTKHTVLWAWQESQKEPMQVTGLTLKFLCLHNVTTFETAT